jgi:hypothetical protein
VELEFAEWVKADDEVVSYWRLASDTRARLLRIRASPDTAHASSLAQVKAILAANLRILAMLRTDVAGQFADVRDELEALLAESEALRSDLFPADGQDQGVRPRPTLRALP